MLRIEFIETPSSKHNILMHPFHIPGVAGVFGESLFSATHSSLVTSSLLSETAGDSSLNAGYSFSQTRYETMDSRSTLSPSSSCTSSIHRISNQSDHSSSIGRNALIWSLVRARIMYKNDYLFQSLKNILKNVELTKANCNEYQVCESE